MFNLIKSSLKTPFILCLLFLTFFTVVANAGEWKNYSSKHFHYVYQSPFEMKVQKGSDATHIMVFAKSPDEAIGTFFCSFINSGISLNQTPGALLKMLKIDPASSDFKQWIISQNGKKAVYARGTITVAPGHKRDAMILGMEEGKFWYAFVVTYRLANKDDEAIAYRIVRSLKPTN
jgi:hypothetical protein